MVSKGRIKIFKAHPVCVSTTEGGENKHTSSLVSSVSPSTESFALITSQSAISSYFFLLLPV